MKNGKMFGFGISLYKSDGTVSLGYFKDNEAKSPYKLFRRNGYQDE